MVLVTLFFACFKEPVVDPIPQRNTVTIEIQDQDEITQDIVEPTEPISANKRFPYLPSYNSKTVRALAPSPEYFKGSNLPSSHSPLTYSSTVIDKENLSIRWQYNELMITGYTNCISENINWLLSTKSNKIWQQGQTTSSPNGFIQLMVPMNHTRRFINIKMGCDNWSLEKDLEPQDTNSTIELYGTTPLQTEKINSVFVTGASNSTLIVWGRPIGNLIWQGKYRIGIGTKQEWQLLHEQHLTKPIEKVSFLIDDKFQQPYELVLQFNKNKQQQQFHTNIFSEDILIGIHAPQSVLVNSVVPLNFFVESLNGVPFEGDLSVTIKSANNYHQHQVPLKDGKGQLLFTPNLGGVYHIIGTEGSQRSETYLWVDGNNADTEPVVIAFPSATYIGGISGQMLINGERHKNGLLYVDTNEQDIVLQKGKETLSLPVLKLSTDYFRNQQIFKNTPKDIVQFINYPLFLRLGDQIEIERIQWSGDFIHQSNRSIKPIGLEPFQIDNHQIPVLLSPSDQIQVVTEVEKLYNNNKKISLEFPTSSYPYYITSDPHFPDTILMSLIEDLHLPHTPISDAHFIQRAALVWDSIGLRKAPWLKQVLKRAQANINYLIDNQTEEGHWSNPKDDWIIVHALLQADKYGVFSATPTMEKAADYICSSPISIPAYHVQQLLNQSVWKHLHCNNAEINIETTQIWQAFWHNSDFELNEKQSFSAMEMGALLQYYAKTDPYNKAILPYLEKAKISDDPWVEFSGWNLVKAQYQRYTKMWLYLYKDGKGTHNGLFHIWQLQHLYAMIDVSQDAKRDLFLQGAGTLNWSLWTIVPQQREAINENGLTIKRGLFDGDGSPLSLESIKQGQQIILVHRIKGPPNKVVSLNIFPAAGLSLQDQGQQINQQIKLNNNGEAIIEHSILAQFKGSFHFPASNLHYQQYLAHTGDWKIEIK
jgi:hypothetical protein